MHHSTKPASAFRRIKAAMRRTGTAIAARSKTTLSILGLSLLATGSHAQGTWTPLLGPMPDYNQGVMILLNDGSVLVKASNGGGSGIGNGWNRLTPDIHGSYVNGIWTVATSMQNSRLYFSSQVLRNGTVYVAGGEYGTGRPFAEIYYTADDMWVPTLPLTNPTDTISDANSEILPDGKVLQAIVLTGNNVSHHTYIYDPATSAFTPGPPTIGLDNESSWLKLPDNSILFPNIYSTNAERYIPATNTWVSDMALPVGLYDPYGYEMGAAFLLPDGRAFFIGSTSHTAYYTPSGTTAPGVWTAGPTMPDSLGAPDAAAAMMVNGKIIGAYSHTPTLDSVFHQKMKFFEFNYLTNTFSPIPSPEGGDSINSPAYVSNMVCLPDGSILYGRQGDDQLYIYKPDGAPLPMGKPTLSDIRLNHCDTFTAVGKLFNGISEGAGYGDDWQMATNYPIIRLTRADTVYYASTYNWSSTGVMRGTAQDTTQFVLPMGIPQGTYQVQVIANGIASDPMSFSFCDQVGVSNVTKGGKHLIVFPNPATDEVTVSYNALSAGEYTVKLTDVYGRSAMEQKHTATMGENNVTLQLSTLARGIYTVSINDGNNVYNTKVVVK